VRQRLIEVVSKTGRHIGAGLGVVELTVALLHAFDSPRDKILWDVGHQGYPWKVLTGRNGGWRRSARRTASPDSCAAPSEHDIFGAGHAGTAISAAYGVAAARDLKGEDYHVVAVIGDGSMTCGLPYEGLNNAGHADCDFVIVLNDNGMSIAPNVGAMSRYLAPGTRVVRELRRERVKHAIEAASHIVGGQKDTSAQRRRGIKTSGRRACFSKSWVATWLITGDIRHAADVRLVKARCGPRLLHVLTRKVAGCSRAGPRNSTRGIRMIR
jgi:deoxyxylulose-5-phosphate synthase